MKVDNKLCSSQKFIRYMIITLSFPFLIYIILYLLSNYNIINVIDVQDFVNTIKEYFIELFGFVGLILVFIYGYLLNTKSELEKHKTELEMKRLDVVYHTSYRRSADNIRQIEVMIDNVSEQITSNNSKIKKVTLYGAISLIIPFTGLISTLFEKFIIVNVEGIHILQITVYIGLLWICFLNVLLTLNTVIKND